MSAGEYAAYQSGHTKGKPEEDCGCFLRTTPARQSSLKVFAFGLRIGIIGGVLAAWFRPRRNSNNKADV